MKQARGIVFRAIVYGIVVLVAVIAYNGTIRISHEDHEEFEREHRLWLKAHPSVAAHEEFMSKCSTRIDRNLRWYLKCP